MKVGTYRAARHIGRGTQWCTAQHQEHFDAYNASGSLFVMERKGDAENGIEKCQFHFGERDGFQLMKQNDRPVSIVDVGIAMALPENNRNEWCSVLLDAVLADGKKKEYEPYIHSLLSDYCAYNDTLLPICRKYAADENWHARSWVANILSDTVRNWKPHQKDDCVALFAQLALDDLGIVQNSVEIVIYNDIRNDNEFERHLSDEQLVIMEAVDFVARNSVSTENYIRRSMLPAMEENMSPRQQEIILPLMSRLMDLRHRAFGSDVMPDLNATIGKMSPELQEQWQELRKPQPQPQRPNFLKALSAPGGSPGPA